MGRCPVTNETELAQIHELLKQGLSNAAISRRTYIDVRTIRRVRKDAGIPPVPRTAWRRAPHPREAQIHELLQDGHSDQEIHRRTGADPRTIKLRRAAAGIGKATIIKSSRENWVHPRDAEIRSLLAKMSNAKIAGTLGVDRAAVARIRKLTGIEWAPTYATAEEKWASYTVQTDGGHTRWTGPRFTASQTPTMKFNEASISPAAIAFRIRTGRDAVGQVRAECGVTHCMTPAHVDDEPGRQHLRAQIRAVRGLGPPPTHCRHGHDQAEHGRYAPDGDAYCEACKRDQKLTSHSNEGEHA